MTEPVRNQSRTKKTDKPSLDFDFGSAIEELEQIARYLENSEINLDEAMKKYERGVELAKKLKAYLKEAENKVKTLQASFEKE